MTEANIRIQNIVLNTQYANNTKAQRIFTTKNVDYPPGEASRNIRIILDKKKDKFLMLELNRNDPNILLPRPISPLESAILDTIYSIYKAGYRYFTLEQLAKVFTGNEKKKITPKLLETLATSINVLASAGRATLRLENELDSGLVKEKIMQGYILPIESVTEKTTYAANGKVTKDTAYHLLEAPILHRYAEKKGKGEIVSFDIGLLDTSETGNSDTLEYTLIKRYVIKKIKQIKAKNRLNNNKISLEWEDKDGKHGLLCELGYDSTNYSDWKKKRFEILQSVRTTLDYYKSVGEIKDFTEYRIGNTKNPAVPIQGFEIIV